MKNIITSWSDLWKYIKVFYLQFFSSLSLILIFVMLISPSIHWTLFILSYNNSRCPSMSNSFMHSCISISFVDVSAHIKFVGIHWYDTVFPSISCSFRSCITFLNDFLSTYFIELIDSHVPAQSFNKFIGILCSYPPNIKVSIYFAANIASSTIFLKIKALVSFDKWHTLSIIFNFQYIGLALVISLFVQVYYCGCLCQ